MAYEVKSFITFENTSLLIKTAEDVGANLGTVASNKILKIYRLLNYEFMRGLSRGNELPDISFLLLARPKIALLVGNSSYRERAALQRFQYTLTEAIDCIIEAETLERFERLKRLHQFIEAVICYQRYFSASGTRSETSPEEKKLRDRINSLQLKMNKLLQFIEDSTKDAKVFLSYSHLDKSFVEHLRMDLEIHGITTWYDTKDLYIGDVLSDAISEAIKQSWGILIVLSKRSVKSAWVNYELNEAYDAHISQGKRILPVLISDLSDEDIPQRLKKHLYADFRNETLYDETLKALCRTIIRKGSEALVVWPNNSFNPTPR